MSQYIVLSLNHTKRRDKAITLWKGADKGYCWKLEPAGVCTETGSGPTGLLQQRLLENRRTGRTSY